jgi:hypothetical protein
MAPEIETLRKLTLNRRDCGHYIPGGFTLMDSHLASQ